MFCTLCGKGEYTQTTGVHVRAVHSEPLALELKVPLVLAHMPLHTTPPAAKPQHADDGDEWN